MYICIYMERERERESVLKKMRGWTTSDIGKVKNLIKAFQSETFSYLVNR